MEIIFEEHEVPHQSSFIKWLHAQLIKIQNSCVLLPSVAIEQKNIVLRSITDFFNEVRSFPKNFNKLLSELTSKIELLSSLFDPLITIVTQLSELAELAVIELTKLTKLAVTEFAEIGSPELIKGGLVFGALGAAALGAAALVAQLVTKRTERRRSAQLTTK